MRWWLAVSLFLTSPMTASAHPDNPANTVERVSKRPKRARMSKMPRLSKRSRSSGHAWDGKLKRGVKLEEDSYLRYTTEYRKAGHFYGTWELVQLMHRAARRVWSRHPGSKLSVGELSKQNGGDIDGHGSHESGRDVDISFYMTRADGTPYEPYAFASFGADGKGLKRNKGLVFDDARNWTLVEKLVADGDARVQYIFVAETIKQRLLRYGRASGAKAVVLERAQKLMAQPATGHPHRNHFHVRIYCPPASRPSCKDSGPMYDWYPGKRP